MKISIAMATYNGAKYLKDQLDSVLNQTFSDWELIIGDDCSTDHTMEILTEYSQKDSRISIFQNDSNLGFKKNFEKIFCHCSGDYIACCDQDDVWTKDHLEVLLNNIGDNDCIGANAAICNNRLSSMCETTLDSVHIRPEIFDSNKLFTHECYYNLIQGTACLFKRSLLSKISPIPDTVVHHDHWIALNASISDGCAYIPNVVLQYRTHEKNAVGIATFSFRHLSGTLRHIPEFRSSMYNSKLAMLQHLLSGDLTLQQKSIIQNAISFFSNLKENQNRIKTTAFFVQNYKAITLSSRKSICHFLYRVLNLALFGIML